jgi:hypothetical protein
MSSHTDMTLRISWQCRELLDRRKTEQRFWDTP